MEAKLDRLSHSDLIRYVAGCAWHVLVYFQEVLPEDDRPENAIQAAIAFSEGKLSVSGCRKRAFDAHAAARTAPTDASKNAARAAGHAAATAHVRNHAKAALRYALASVFDHEKESRWQWDSFPHDDSE
jgi:hypothetical protein